MLPSFRISLFLSLCLVSSVSSAFVLCSQNNGRTLEGAPVIIRSSCQTNELQITATELQSPSTPAKTPRAIGDDSPVHENLDITVRDQYDVSARTLLLKNNQVKFSKPGSSMTIDYENILLQAAKELNFETDKKVNIRTTPSVLLLDKKTLLDAADEIVIKTGKASITLKKDGNISINGTNIDITASGLINTKASKDVVMKGSKITAN